MSGTGYRGLVNKIRRGRPRRFRALLNLALLAIIAAMVSVPMLAAPPALAAADVTLSASSGPPGTSVIVSGTGFTDGDTYAITFAPGSLYEHTFISNATVSGTTFTQTIVIPPVPWAQHTIRIQTTGGTFLKPFLVTPQIETSVNTGYVGDTIVVTGAGFRLSANVSISFNNSLVTTTTTDVNGTLAQASFAVPELRSGNYNINATDGAASSPVVIFTVRPRLVLNAAEGAVEDRVVLHGSGFEYNSQISVFWDNDLATSSLVLSNATGVFTANFTIPAGTAGSHTIKASDLTSRLASAGFTIIPKITLSPASSAPGGAVTITGNGFRLNTALTVTYNGIPVPTVPTTVTTNSAGSFTATFIVPSGISGNYLVRASDGFFAATASFAVTSKIDVTPVTGNVGTELRVFGVGFTPSGKITLSYDAQEIAAINIDATGAFTASFKAPASKAGAHTVSARDQTVTGLIVTATFTMESIPPEKPSLLAPETGSQATVTPKFAWSGVTDPSGVTYSLQVAADAGLANIALFKTGLTAAEYAVTPLEALGLVKKPNPFFWRVKAVDGAGNESAWSAAGSFYTQDSAPPQVPLPLNPPLDSQADTRPAFDWSDVADPSGVSYNLQVARDSGFSRLVLDKQGIGASNYQAAASEQLALVKKLNPYYWRVRAVDGAGNESEWSAIISFYTQDSTPPPVPTLLRPEPASRQGGETFFDWTDAVDPSGTAYTLQVARDAAFSRLVAVKENLQASEYKLSKTEKLSPNTGDAADTYFWRVKAVDGAGNESAWSNITGFRVRNFLQSGWPVYIAIAIGGLLLLAVGVFIGQHLKSKPPA